MTHDGDVLVVKAVVINITRRTECDKFQQNPTTYLDLEWRTS
jgi:hypothetical protein